MVAEPQDASPQKEHQNLLSIGLDQVGFIVLKAREFEVDDIVDVVEDGVDDGDDLTHGARNHYGDAVQHEIKSYINAMNVDEQIDLVALTWLGRGDYSAGEWAEVRREAESARNDNTALYLFGTPHLPDHLENGLATLGLSCDEITADHLALTSSRGGR